MAAILTRSVVYPSSKKTCDHSSAPWKIAPRCLPIPLMARKRKTSSFGPKGVPHEWAYLAEWRDVSGLTQENVAGTLDVSGVTVHRWETGKAAVSMANMMKLAKLYGASDVGMLSLPPPSREQIAAIREAWKIVASLSPEDRSAWLSHGRIMAVVAGPTEKLPET